MKPITRLLLMIPGARQNGKVWSARCPAHHDQQTNLSIAEGDDGRARLHCHAGCKPDAVCTALGLRASDILPTAAEPPLPGDVPNAHAPETSSHAQTTSRSASPEVVSAAPDRTTAGDNGLLPLVGPPPDRVNSSGSANALPSGPAVVAPKPPAPPDALRADHPGSRRKVVIAGVRLSDVDPRPVRWLWPGRIALGKLTIVSGDPGLGKSFLSCDLAARISTGREWPDNKPDDGPDGRPNRAPRGSVILLNSEDDLEDTIRPRLDRHGADVSRIIALSGVSESSSGNRERRFDLARDLPALEVALRTVGDCKLVVIDPLTAYLGDRHDSHKTADVRSLLAPLAQLAARYEVAVVAVSHLNKGNGAAIYRTTGSLAFVAAARAVWGVTRDPENPARRMFLPIKNNLGNDATGLAYSIFDGRICWEVDPVTVSADDAVTSETERSLGRELAEAQAWLTTALAPGTPMPSKIILADARECGITERRLRAAARGLGVVIAKAGMKEGWTWTRPEDSGGSPLATA